MTRRGLVFIGGPGSGEGTITAALGAAEPRMSLVGKIRAGMSCTATYRILTRGELGSLCAQGLPTGRSEQYTNVYAIDVRDVLFCVRQGLLPVTQAGYPSRAVAAVAAEARRHARG